jgi:hypothetical protein
LDSLSKIKDLEERLQDFEDLNIKKLVEDASNSDEKSIFLLDLIKNRHKAVPRCSEMSIRLCTVWRYCSPKSYKFCHSNLIKLPSKATISRFVGQYNGQNELIKNRLSAEIAKLQKPIERVCSLILDDMSIRPKLHYSRSEDQIYGLDTVKSKTVGEQPAGYFFHSSLTTNELYSLTKNVLQLLSDCGYIVLRLVTDNISTNVALFKKFGNGSLKIQIEHPIMVQLPLFLSFDFCHALKNARNLFLDHDMCSTEGRISASYLFPSNFEKMNVLRAIQIFVPTVTASLKFLQEAGDSRFLEVSSTISYMENMYHFFQVHNVSNRQHYIRSLDSAVAPYIHVSDERLQWLNTTFPSYIDDIQQNSRSFSSDPIEGMFSHIRLKGGSQDQTDARAADYAIRQILRCGIVKASSSANTAQNINFISQAKIPSKTYGECVTTNIEELILPTDVRTSIQSLSQNITPANNIFSASVAFLSGYIIKKLEDQFHCDECLVPLLSTTIPGPLLRSIALQDRGRLIYPNNAFVGIIERIANIAQKLLPFLQHEKPCLQLHDLLYDHLFQNSVFSCAQHKAAAFKNVFC